MKTFTESDRLNAEKYLKLAIPADADTVRILSWSALHGERSQARKAASALLERARKDNREVTAEEEQAFDTAMTYLENLNEEFDRRDISGKKEPEGGDQPYRVTYKSKGSNMNERLFAPRRTWRDIFQREPRAVTEGARTFADAIIALHQNDDQKLRELRTMNAIAGTEGGYSVPEQTWAEIYDSGLEASVCLDKVSTFPMQSDTLYISGWDSDDKTQGPIGAVKGSWIGETNTATVVTPKLRMIGLFAKKLGLYVNCSSEILQDSVALGRSLGTMMRNSLAFTLDESILTGSGISQPQGVLNSAGQVNVGRSAAGNIAFADLYGMMGRMLPSSLDKCIWVVSPSAFATMLGMVTSSGSGELILSYQPGAADIKMQLFGREVRVSEKLPTKGSKGDVMLLDLSYYALGMRETGRFERTNAANWTSDIVDFRLILRCDGKALINAPFTPAGGGSTLSPFVVLDA